VKVSVEYYIFLGCFTVTIMAMAFVIWLAFG